MKENYAGGVRNLEIPPPPSSATIESSLVSRLGSKRAANRAVSRVAAELGVSMDDSQNVLRALALAKLGGDLDRIAKSLAWDEFEAFCGSAISAAGYSVQRNVRLRKPTRQVDIVAESASLVLSVDCKHWKRAVGARGLERLVRAQAARTRQYAGRLDQGGARSYLPVLLTMMDNQ
ncbi:MAG: restriction endonuclease, partial [Thaumarchaeota archaeon]|nr:restriction endonuclease [Nitrososphaerota archaeon]